MGFIQSQYESDKHNFYFTLKIIFSRVTPIFSVRAPSVSKVMSSLDLATEQSQPWTAYFKPTVAYRILEHYLKLKSSRLISIHF